VGKQAAPKLKKLAFLSDNPWVTTGHARVIRELGAQWRKRYDLVSLGWRCNTKHLVLQPQWDTYPLRAELTGGLQGDRDLREVLGVLKQEEPDLLLCLGDLMHFRRMRELHDALPKTTCVGYINVDGTMLPPSFASVALAFDRLVATSAFGAAQLSELTRTAVPYAHHGVDTTVFRPVTGLPPDKPCVFQSLFDEAVGAWDDHFVVLSVGRNISRKSLPTLLEIYAAAHERCPLMRLILMTNPKDHFGASLIEIASRLGVLTKIGFVISLPTRAPNVESIDDEALNVLLNRAAVTIMPSLGEGFGLLALESMAAGTPVLAADNSALHELVEGRGVLLPCSASLWAPNSSIRLRLVDVERASASLVAAYDDWAAKGPALPAMREKGLAFARTRTWRACADRIDLGSAKRRDLPKLPGDINPAIESLVTMNVGVSERPRVFVSKFGGLGDYVQLTPILAGVRRRHPEHDITLLAEKDYGLFDASPNVDRVLEIGMRPQHTVARSCLPHCEIYYDVRYVSRVYAPSDPAVASPPGAPLQWFYDTWAYSNARLATLGKHVIDLMIDSCGLREYCSLADLAVPQFDLPLQAQLPRPYVVVHNAAGNVGNLKTLDPDAFREVARWLQAWGYNVVQVGASKDEALVPSAIDLRGRTPHPYELAAVLRGAHLYFGVEGGVMHLAKAVGIPHAAFFSITPPNCFAYPDTIVLTNEVCPPCWWHVGATWAETCPLDHQRCLNFPSADHIIATLAARVPRGATKEPASHAHADTPQATPETRV